MHKSEQYGPVRRALQLHCRCRTETLMGRRTGKSMILTFRRFEDRDAEACASIINECFERMTECKVEGIKSIADSRNFRVVEMDGEVAGVAGYSNMNYSAMVLDVAVKSSLRREGIGSFLIGNLVEEIKSIPGMCTIWLDATPEAINIYRRLGFRTKRSDLPEYMELTIAQHSAADQQLF